MTGSRRQLGGPDGEANTTDVSELDPTFRLVSIVPVLLAAVLLLTVPAPAAATPIDADPAAMTGSVTDEATAEESIALTQELSLTPGRPGEIQVTIRYTIPENVVELRTTIPEDTTVIRREEFEKVDETTYAWTGDGSTPSLTYRLPVNRTLDAPDPIAGRGDYSFVDPGPWALVSVPGTGTEWKRRGSGSSTIDRSRTIDGPGVVGKSIAYLGAYREHTRTTGEERVRLIVPAAASLTEDPSTVLDSLGEASRQLAIGGRNDRVLIVAAPTDGVRWGVRGLQRGDADAWVRDNERVDSVDNTWVHEYVHTRQDYSAATETRWFTEASATYYATLLTLENGRIDYGAFAERLALGTQAPQTDAVLADPSTWRSVAPYTKGALVAGEVDRRIRTETDGSRTLQGVFARMNAQDDPVSGDAFRGHVRRVGTAAVVAATDRYVTTSATPELWDRAAFERAFDREAPQITVAVPPADRTGAYHVEGPYRSGPLSNDRPITLVPGETLYIDLSVENVGTAAGEYAVDLTVDGSPVDTANGSLDPGDSRSVTVAHRFDETGKPTVHIDGTVIPVSVRQPASPSVTNLSVRAVGTPSNAKRRIEATVTVENPSPVPAEGDLVLERNGEAVATERVRLAPETSSTVVFPPDTVPPGTYTYHVAGLSATVEIGSTETATPPVSERGSNGIGGRAPGLGAVSVLIALCLAVLLRIGRVNG